LRNVSAIGVSGRGSRPRAPRREPARWPNQTVSAAASPPRPKNGIGLGPGGQGDKTNPAQGQPPCPFLAKQGSPEAGQARANQNLCFHPEANLLFFNVINKKRTE
jgi:hypothetical protein